MDLAKLLRVRPALRTTQELKEIKVQLENCPFFADWADESLTQISGVLGCASFAAGEKVTEPGEAVSSIFIVLSGSCDHAVPHATDPRVAPQHRILHPGDVCGREAVLFHDPRARGRVTAGPSGALLATLSSSAWAGVCTRATAGSAPWIAARADLLCSFLRQLVSAATGSDTGSQHGQQEQQQQLHGQDAASVLRESAGSGRREGGSEGGLAVEDPAEGPAEALRLELMAVLLASLPSNMAAMPQSMLREATKSCYVRTVRPYSVLYSGRNAPKFQAVLLSGEMQVRKLRPDLPSESLSGPATISAAGSHVNMLSSDTAASMSSPLPPPASLLSLAEATVAAPPGEAVGKPLAAAGERGPSSEETGISISSMADSVTPGGWEKSYGTALETPLGMAASAGEDADDEGVDGGQHEDDDDGDDEVEDGDEEEEEEEGDEGGGEHGADDNEEAERRLANRFGRMVGTVTRGSVLLELPLVSISRRKRRNGVVVPPRAAALTTGALPAAMLILPLWALRRGYEVARAALVASRVAFMSSSCKPLRELLSAKELTSLALAARPLWLAGGAVVARQGEQVEALLLVEEGEVRLLDDPGGGGALHHHNQHDHHSHHHHNQHHHKHHQHHHQHHHHHHHHLPHHHHQLGGTGSAPTRGYNSSALVLAAFLEDPVMSSEGSSRAPWSSYSHPYNHQNHHGPHDPILAAAPLDVSAAQVQRSLAHLTPLMIVEPGGVLGESVLGCSHPPGGGDEEQDGEEEDEELMSLQQQQQQGDVGGKSGNSATHKSQQHPSGQLPPLPHASSSSMPLPPHLPQQPQPALSPAPPTNTPSAAVGRSPLHNRPSVHRIATATMGTAAATADTADDPPSALGAAESPTALKEQHAPQLLQPQQLQQDQAKPPQAQQHQRLSAELQVSHIKQEPNSQCPSPTPPEQQQQQHQQMHDAQHNHHKQMQHLHRLLVKQSHEQLTQPTDNHHNSNLNINHSNFTYCNPHRNSSSGNNHNRNDNRISNNGHLHGAQTHAHTHTHPPMTSLDLTAATAASVDGTMSTTRATASASAADVQCGGNAAAAVTRADTGATATEAAADGANDASAAAAAAAAATWRGVFPATAVAVGVVRLLAVPRKALLRLPQLQPVMAAQASEQLQVLEQRRRDAQEMRNRLMHHTAAAADGGPGDLTGVAPSASSLSTLSTSPSRDPYEAARRRQSERRAAVGALNGATAAALQAPAVLPTEEMMARPSVALEKMGFKVPKLRGALQHSTSVGGGVSVGAISRRASEHTPQPQPLAPMEADGPIHSSLLLTSPAIAAATRQSSTGEVFGGLVGSPEGRLLSVLSACAAVAAVPKMPALPPLSSSMVGVALVDLEASAAAATSPMARGAAAAAAAGTEGMLSGGDNCMADRLRASISMPERSGHSFSGKLTTSLTSVTLPRISTADGRRSLRGNGTGSSVRGERTFFGLGGSVAGGIAPSEPRSCSGSPMRRSPRVYDMDAYVASATNSRSGSFRGTCPGVTGGGGIAGRLGALGGMAHGDSDLLPRYVSSAAAAAAGVDLVASAGSPRCLSLSGVPSGPAGDGAAAAAASLLPKASVPLPQALASTGLSVRTAPVSSPSRLVIPDEGPLGRSSRAGSGAMSPVGTASQSVTQAPLPPSWRPNRITYEDGRLPALASPQRPSRMFQEEAAAAAAALLRGHTAAGVAMVPPPAPPARPGAGGGGGKSFTKTAADAAAARGWLEEHVSSFSTGSGGGGVSTGMLHRMTLQGTQSSAAQPPPPPSLLQKSSAGAANVEVAVAALRRGSGVGL